MASTQSFITLQAAITQKSPFCSGAIDLSSTDGLIFYKQGREKAGWIDLSKATDDQLETLAQACAPATFGLDQQDVLDETYRKAGKMDIDQFSTKFDVVESLLIDRIRTQLLHGADERKPIKAELYKLNVYGKGSFFLSHKDTPRSDTMFGSLVLVFPTPHEGGNLVLRHHDKEWTFNAAEATRDKAVPAIAYIAFYSDVDHEVTLVKSGYRVTLTYNLYFEDELQGLPTSITPIDPSDLVLKTAFSDALSDPSFLPEGGLLGFGLSFMYPVSPTPSPGTKPLQDLRNRLKGSDAMIKRVCDQLSLNVSLKAIYVDTECKHHVMVNEIVDMSQWELYDVFMSTELCERPYNGQIIYDMGTEPPRQYRWGSAPPVKNAVEVLWVTPLTAYSHFKSTYIAHGNQPTIEHVYGDICLMVEVGKPGERLIN